MNTANICYPVSDELVTIEIAAACARIEERRTNLKAAMVGRRAEYEKATVWSGHAPQTDEQIDTMVDGWIAEQRTRYAEVRVIRLAGHADGQKSYVLDYSDRDVDDVGSGTGPFATLSNAVDWFTSGGR